MRQRAGLLLCVCLTVPSCATRETEPGPPAVAAVTVEPAQRTVVVGGTVQLAARPRDAAGTALAGRTVSWTSSDSSVATVTQGGGLVRGVAAGAATVTATCEGIRGSSEIAVTNPAPAASALSPGGAWQGAPSLVVEVSGAYFQPASEVRWNGAPRATTYVSESLLRATLGPADLAAAGTASVTVWTAAPGGGESAPLPLTVLPRPVGRIVFTRGDDVWTMSADGSSQANVTQSAGARDANPDWSPDGSRILFDSDRDGNRELYVMNADGSGGVRLTSSPGSDSAGVWSPDGSRIAYLCGDGTAQDVCVIRSDGTGRADLTPGGSTDIAPMWSPDGSRLAFNSYRDGNWEIHVMAADGTGATNVSQHVLSDHYPQWSPDGTRVMYYSNRTGNWDVYLVGPDGFNLTNLTHSAGDDHASLWSPTGTQIAFMSERTGAAQIYVMSATGTGVANVSGGEGESIMASWSPDGEWLAFTSSRTGNWDIYVVRADGGPQVRLTYDAADDELGWRGLAWGPARAGAAPASPMR